MKILLWHGYLLTGSGSNVYTANVARVWRAQGHDVLLMCQDRHAGRLDFVDGYGDFTPDNSSFHCAPTGAPPADSAGRLRVARPSIGEILPVYVLDPYEGFTAKRFIDLTAAELTAYVTANVDALATAVTEFRPDRVIIGHEVMGPYIGREVRARTGTHYSVKLHGSALEYAVKLQERYLDAARDGFTAADTIVGTSEYMCREAAATVPGDWSTRTAVVNPGCDVDLFLPRPRAAGAAPTAGFVGKLITAKGPQNMLAALGLTRTPGLRVVIVGYGDFEDELRAFDLDLRAGDVAKALARLGDDPHTRHAREFLTSPAVDGAYLARYAATPVVWTGRLDHDRLPGVLPDFDVLVVPSEVPEAFGMVGAEAAAAGVLPVVPLHSGIGEIGVTAEAALGEPGLLTYDPEEPVRGIAARLDTVFAHDPGARAVLTERAVALARERWSWTTTATGLLEVGAPPAG